MSNLPRRCQLAPTSIFQLEEREKVEDHLSLLHEPWFSFAQRSGTTPDQAEEIHTKFTAEDWESCGKRRAKQLFTLDAFFNKLFAEIRQQEENVRKRHIKSKEVINYLISLEDQFQKTKIPCRHMLYVDFQEKQQQHFAAERNFVEAEEIYLRAKIDGGETLFHYMLMEGDNQNKIVSSLREKSRTEREEAERQQIEHERIRQEELRKEEEEQRKLDEEQAERQRKEQVEMEKRLERRRRDEERRAKARAGRTKVASMEAGGGNADDE